MPLDTFMTSMNDIALIAKARSFAARDCMHSLGFKQWTADTVPMATTNTFKELDLVDYPDPATAAESGYPGITPRQPLQFDRKPAARSTPTRPDREGIEVLMGRVAKTKSGLAVPSGGCLEAGDRKIRSADAETAPEELAVDPRALAADAKFSALRDSRMQSANAAWSSCMEQKGLRYADPRAARSDPRWAGRKSEEPASEEEKRAAEADATCKQAVNLFGIYKALEAAYQKVQVGKHASALVDSTRVFKSWVENAQRIVAKG
ncbi:hypothetical protein AB0C33_15185 [Nonomuraea sp. NPDC048881]|uniref:hypothetical protein n=1 Tax=Nonomuraea sp. NPDC048881 TaxID=3155030 RepID=UPI00340998F7